MSTNSNQKISSKSMNTASQLSTPKAKRVGKFQIRLFAIVLGVTIPILLAVVIFISNRADAIVMRLAEAQLQASNQAIANNVSLWLDFNRKMLFQLALLPEIISMDSSKQKPILESTTTIYPYMYLVHTTDLNGDNVARSDQEANTHYSDRPWFIRSVAGDPFTVQSVIGRTSQEPAVTMGTPIRNPSGQIVGVLGLASDLDAVTQEVSAKKIGETGYAYVVDAENRVIAHPNSIFTSELRDLSSYPPIAALRQGTEPGFITFTDGENQSWRAYVTELDNGWAVVVQQQTSELLSSLRAFQLLALSVTVIGLLILLGLLWLTSNRLVRPINVLTETATAIAAGDITRQAPVERDDEIGILATAFNSMTTQLRYLIDNLAQKASNRTRELETVIRVSQRLSSILELNDLMREVVTLTKETFGYYHVHIYLLDEERNTLIMAEGYGEVGAEMKRRNHQIPLNAPKSLVARVAREKQVILVKNVQLDPSWLPNPLLPDTRSEMAIPVQYGARTDVVGVLDVQSDQVGGLSDEDKPVMQALADQIATAVRNARLFTETQETLNTAQRLQALYLGTAWEKLMQSRETEFEYHQSSVLHALPEIPNPEAEDALKQGRTVYVNLQEASHTDNENGASQLDGAFGALATPLKIRGETIGVFGIQHHEPGRRWTSDEIALIEAVSEQMSLALENARLFEETGRRASRERIIADVTQQVWSADEIEAVMRTAVTQLGEKLQASEVIIRLGSGTNSGSS
ncbi:MAG TPA: GAF domain-containing protein [Anaerolineae bacterium]|nr:GAF domain-containing protein [Anaerolineae bacterium]HRV90831.1 GAF domain-containing protein [Anaerolineae bacterium]